MNVLIIGGGKASLGQNIAARFLNQADNVSIIDKHKPAIAVDYLIADATDDSFGDLLLIELNELRPELVINFVGAIDFQMCRDLDIQRFQNILNINLRPLAACAMALSNYRSPTSFIQIGSNAGSYPFTGMFSYSTAKAAQKQAIKILAKELAPRSRANLINPGPFAPGDSGMSDRQIPLIFGKDKPIADAVESMKARIPMGELCTREELFNLIQYVGVTSNYVTGQVFELSGGQIL